MSEPDQDAAPPDRRKSRLRYFFVILYLLALARELLAAYAGAGNSLDDVSIALVMGRAMGGLILPALVVVPWRMSQLASGRITRTPIIVGSVLFVVQYLAVANAPSAGVTAF